MADEQNLNVNLRSTSDTSGAEKMAKAIKDTGDAAKEAGQAASEAKTGFGELGEALVAIAEMVGFLEFMKESVKEFYEDEKAIRAVVGAAQAYGMNVEKVRRETEEWTAALSRLSGVSDNELTSAVGRQLMLTGDLEQAQSRVALATDIATRYGKTFAEGYQILTAATNGQARALREYIPGISNVADKTEAAALAINFLEKNVRGATAAVQDHAKAADQATARWQQFQKTIGAEVAPAITWLRGAFATLYALILDGVETIGARFIQFGKNIAAFAEMMVSPRASFAGFLKAVERNAQEAADTIREIADTTAKKLALTDADLARQVAEGTKQRVKSNVDAAKQIFDEDRKWMLKEFEEEQRNQARRLAAQNQYHKNLKKLREESTSDILRHFGIEETAEEEMHRKVMELLRKTVAAKKAAAKFELEMQVQVAQGVIGLATDVFGASKETAIASAVINTYEGATKALAQGGIYGAVLAAVVIAAGIAQIAKIESAEPATGGLSTRGAGFDDPENDAEAYRGGRRWAKDMVSKWAGGVDAGWSDGMRGGTTYNQQTYDNSRRTTINASIQDPSNIESVKKLIRTIKMVDQNVLGATTIATRTK